MLTGGASGSSERPLCVNRLYIRSRRPTQAKSTLFTFSRSPAHTHPLIASGPYIRFSRSNPKEFPGEVQANMNFPTEEIDFKIIDELSFSFGDQVMEEDKMLIHTQS